MKAAARVPACRDCWEEFDAASSPDLDRCPQCAEQQAWHDGLLLITGQPRLGKRGAGVLAPFDRIVSAPVGREQEEV